MGVRQNGIYLGSIIAWDAPYESSGFQKSALEVLLKSVDGEIEAELLDSYEPSGDHWYSAASSDPISDVGDGAVHTQIPFPVGRRIRARITVSGEAEFAVWHHGYLV